MKPRPSISAVIVTNPDWFWDQGLLKDCLLSLKWVDQILLLASRKTVDIRKIAENFKAEIILQRGQGFADWRNSATAKISSDWILYVDTDERVPDKLRKEILQVITENQFSAYDMPRSNRILGKEMRYGGWWPDYVLRLIKKSALVKWEGFLHEQPRFNGRLGRLSNPLLHLKHDNLEEMVVKTFDWSKKEALLLYQADHPHLNSVRFIRLSIYPFFTSFIKRYILKKGFLDGTEGLIDAIYQSYSQFISFAQLWEMQIETKIQKLETRN